MDNKSAQILLNALAGLVGNVDFGGAYDGTPVGLMNSSSQINAESSGSSFQNGYDLATELSNIFSSNNEELSRGWANVADFTSQIFTLLKSNLSGVAEKINEFSTTTLSSEEQATDATTSAKTKADEILSNLGLRSDT